MFSHLPKAPASSGSGKALANIAPKPQQLAFFREPVTPPAVIGLPLEHVQDMTIAGAAVLNSPQCAATASLNSSLSSQSSSDVSAEWNQSFTELLNSATLPPNPAAVVSDLENTPPTVGKPAVDDRCMLTPVKNLHTIPPTKCSTPISPSKKPLKKRPIVLAEIQNSPVKARCGGDDRIEGALALVQLANAHTS